MRMFQYSYGEFCCHNDKLPKLKYFKNVELEDNSTYFEDINKWKLKVGYDEHEGSILIIINNEVAAEFMKSFSDHKSKFDKDKVFIIMDHENFEEHKFDDIDIIRIAIGIEDNKSGDEYWSDHIMLNRDVFGFNAPSEEEMYDSEV